MLPTWQKVCVTSKSLKKKTKTAFYSKEAATRRRGPGESRRIGVGAGREERK